MKKLLLAAFYLFGLVSLQSCSDSNQEVSQGVKQSSTQVNSGLSTDSKATELETEKPESKPTYPLGQLSKDIVPSHYVLDLTIVPDNKSFSGKVSIDVDINKSLNKYYLHGNLLEVSKVELKDSIGVVHSGSYKQVDDSGVAELNFKKSISIGKANLTIEYQAPFDTSSEGLYKVKDGELNYAFTQFEATSARLSFPGFDEPAFKVPFKISITGLQKHIIIANTPEEKVTQLNNGMKRVDFVETKPLPTYLLAYAVGEFDEVVWEDLPTTAVRKVGIPLRGFATKGKGGDLNFALEHTQRILESLENYFQIPYPYRKLDIIAVPDFNAGAMENAGLITYREQLLLLKDNASISQKRSYMGVHAHELAHQWFGNLVTPYWWNDIWLNEAFATWMSYTALHDVYPEHNFKQQILTRSLGAMSSDSLVNARQIRQPILSNHDISTAFDGITYSKGGGVLEMMNTFLTPEQFRIGIQNYMKKHAFKNATADDFIEAISEASQSIPAQVIQQSFGSFLEQPGIPYLSLDSSCEDGKNTIDLKQSRYLPLGSKGSDEKTWQIPVCLSYEIDSEEFQHCQIVSQGEQQVELAGTGCAKFIMPNSNGSAYYRYGLSSEKWSQLYDNLDSLNTNEIISLNDSFIASLTAGKADFSDLMNVAPKMVASNSTDIAKAPMAFITFMKEKVAEDEVSKQKIAKQGNQLYKAKLDSIGFESDAKDSVETIKLRKSLIGFLAITVENKQVREKLVKIAKTYTGYQGDEKIHAELVDNNLISVALDVAVLDLDKEFTNHLVKLFESSNDGTVRNNLLGALTESKDPEFAKETRSWILSDKLRNNELYYVIYNQMAADSFQNEMWQWIQDNIEPLKKRIPYWGQGRLPGIGFDFCSESRKNELNEFFAKRVENLSGGPRTLAQTKEGIDLCIAKVKYNKPKLKSYLDSI